MAAQAAGGLKFRAAWSLKLPVDTASIYAPVYHI